MAASSPTRGGFASISMFTFAKAFAAVALLWTLFAWLRYPMADHLPSHTGPVPPEVVVDIAIEQPVASPVTHAGASAVAPAPVVVATSGVPQVATGNGPSAAGKTQKHTDRVAVIIENRPTENLVTIMMHFHKMLGPKWHMILYTVPSTEATLKQNATFLESVNTNETEIRYLPEWVDFTEHRAVSLFLTDEWIWLDLKPYQKIFMFQTDSILCSAANVTVDDFIEYDFIGAPIEKGIGGLGFNGGMGIRDRTVVLECITRWSFAAESKAPNVPARLMYEDQWLYQKMLDLPPKEDGSPGAHLPEYEVAMTFAVETIFYPTPLGYHQPQRWQKDNMDKIAEWCPETSLMSGSFYFPGKK